MFDTLVQVQMHEYNAKMKTFITIKKQTFNPNRREASERVRNKLGREYLDFAEVHCETPSWKLASSSTWSFYVRSSAWSRLRGYEITQNLQHQWRCNKSALENNKAGPAVGRRTVYESDWFLSFFCFLGFECAFKSTKDVSNIHR